MENFSWAAAADVAGGLAGGFSAWGNASAQAIVAKANANAQNKIREGQNEVKAANNDLTATIRSINNKRLIEAAGKAQEAAITNRLRTHDANIQNNFERDLRDAEANGAREAKFASMGIGGSAIRAASLAAGLQQARVAQRIEQAQGQRDYDMVKEQVGLVATAVGNMDRRPFSGGLDYGFNAAAPGGTNWFSALASGILSKKDSLQTLLGSMQTPGAATAFGIPDATIQTTDLPPLSSSEIVSVPLESRALGDTGLGGI